MQYDREILGQVTNLESALRRCGLELPPAVVAAIDQANTDAADLAAGTAGDVAAAVLQARAAGKNPETDKKVTAALLATLTGPANGILATERARRTVDAIRAHAGEVIADLADVVDAAQHDLEAARNVCGTVDVAGEIDPTRSTPEVAAAFATYRDAAAKVDTAVRAWQTVATITGTRTGDRTLIVAPLDPDQRAAMTVKAGAAEVIAAGIRLDLADLDGYRQRADELRAARERQTQADDAAGRYAIAKVQGITVG